MPNYSKYEIILVRYPFSDLSNSKVRPAVVISSPHVSQDLMITPLTSKINSLIKGEFVLSQCLTAGLNVATAIKRGIYTVHENLVVKKIGVLVEADAIQLVLSGVSKVTITYAMSLLSHLPSPISHLFPK